MATLGFPSNPSTGTVYTVGTRTWIWTGQGWKIDSGNTSLNTLTAVSIVVTTSTNATSTDSGAIKVVGGVGIGGDVYVGGGVFIGQTSTIGGYEILTTASVNQFANQTSITAGTDTAVSTSTGAITIWNVSTLQSVTDRGSSTTNSILINNASVSTSNNTGALVVTGGVGVGGDLYVGGKIVAQELDIQYTTITTTIIQTDDIIKTTNDTQSDSTYSGALVVSGGAGIGKDLYLGGDAYVRSFYAYSTNTESKIYGPVVIYNQSSSTSVLGGAFQVYGGVGIRGDLHVGNIFSNGDQVLTSKDGTPNFVSKIIAGDDISVSSATGEVTVSDISTLQSVTNRGANTNNALSITNYDSSTSTDTGALTIYGGLGVGENIFAGGSINALSLKVSTFSTITGNLSVGSVIINSSANSSGLYTGALQMAGGMSVVGNIYSGGNVYANGYLVNTGTFTGGVLSNKTRITNSETSTSTDTGALQVIGGAGIGGDVYVGGVGYFDHIITRGTATSEIYGPLQVDNVLTVYNNIGSTASNNGALVVAGGVGIGENLNVNGNITVGGDFTATNIYGVFRGTISGSVDTANYAAAVTGGSPGTLLYQISSTQTGFVTTSLPGYVLVSNGTESPVYQNTLTLSSTATSIDPFTGALTVAGGVGIGENLNVVGTIKGNNLQISGYDYVSTVSGYLDAGIIKVTAPLEFFNASSTDSGALQVIGGAGIGGTVYIGQDLHVAGTAFLNNAEVLTTQSGLSSVLGVSVINQILKVTTATNSTSTDSGAVVVTGGVGIGKDLYVGGDLTIKGSLVVTTASIGSSAVTSITAGTDTAVYGTVGNITIWNTSNLQSVTDRGNTTSNSISVTNSTSSTSTDSGALTVAGGVGIGGDLYVGGVIYSSSSQVLTFANTSSLLVAYAEYATTSGYALSFDTGTVVTNAISATTSNFATTSGYALSFDTGTVVTSAISATTSNFATTSGYALSFDTGTIVTSAIYASSSTYAETAGVALALGTGTFTIVNTINSTSTDTGALQVYGGVGIGGNLYVGGEIVAQKLTIEYTTITTTIVETDDIITTFNSSSSTSTTTGALVVAGGVGIGGDVYVGGDLKVSGALVVTTASISSSAVTSITAGTDTAVYGTVGSITIWNTSTLQTITNRGNSTTNAVLILNTDASTSTTTGALQVRGGAAIGEKLFVGSDANINGSLTLAPVIWSYLPTTFTNIPVTYGATHLTFTLEVDDTITNMSVAQGAGGYGPGSVNLVIPGTTFPGGTSPANDIVFEVQTFFSPGPVYSTDVTSTVSYVSGTLPPRYDSIKSTGNVGIGAENNHWTFGTDGVLTLPDGGLITSVSNGVNIYPSAGQAAVISNFSSNNQLYAWDNNVSIQTSPNNAGAIFNTWVFGTDGNLTNPGAVSVLSSVNSTSSTTGALTVAGGVGVELDMYVGGTIYSNNSQVVTFANTASLISSNAGFASTSGFALSFNTGTLVNVAVSASTSNFATTSGFALSFNTGTLVNIAIFASSSTYANVAGIANNLGTGTYAIINNTNSTSTNSGALTVTGGVGIGGTVNVGERIFINGAEVLTTSSVNQFANQTAIFAGTDTAVSSNSGTSITIWNTSTLQTVSDRGNSTTNAILITNITDSAGTNSGALQVVGGAGIGGNLYVGGDLYQRGAKVVTTSTVQSLSTSTLAGVTQYGATTPDAIRITNTSSSTSTVTGALVITGGVGIGGSLYIGQPSYIGGAQILTTATLISSGGGITTVNAGTDTAVYSYNGIVTVWNTSTLETVTGRGNSTTNKILILNATAASSTNSGALQVSGGAGIGGDLYIGGSLYQNGQQVLTTASVNQFANQTSITAGTDIAVSTSTGNIIISNTSTLQTVTGRGNSTTNTISITNTTGATSTNSGALQVAGGVGIGGNLYVGGEIVAQKLTIQLTTVTTTQVTTDDIISTYNITNATSTNSGALQVAGGAGIGGNLYVGSTIYSSGNVVLTTATVNQFANQTSIIAGVGISVSTSSGNITVSNTGVTTATGSTYIGVNTATGSIVITNLGVTNLNSGTDITLSATTGSITINNTSTLQSITGRGATTTNIISFVNTTASTSTTTGAVVITGGLAVGGQINATSIVAGGVRSTTGSNSPADPTVGDMWYNTTNDRLYRYTANGVINFWLDYTGPIVQYPTIF